ncbi:MAG TPA: SemiSWEET transporter [Ignavibacteria bacterium]|nr:SemiSWEET transporter [Ignavibacteria bacterium]
MEINIITIIGLFAAACTTFAYLPQSIKTIRTRHTKDLSLFTLILLEFGIVSWLIYGIGDNDIPVIAANTISLLFISVILIFKIRYK